MYGKTPSSKTHGGVLVDGGGGRFMTEVMKRRRVSDKMQNSGGEGSSEKKGNFLGKRTKNRWSRQDTTTFASGGDLCMYALLTPPCKMHYYCRKEFLRRRRAGSGGVHFSKKIRLSSHSTL